MKILIGNLEEKLLYCEYDLETACDVYNNVVQPMDPTYPGYNPKVQIDPVMFCTKNVPMYYKNNN